MVDLRFIPLTLNTNTGAPANRSIQRVFPQGGNGGGTAERQNWLCTHSSSSYYSGGGQTDYYWTCTNDYNGGGTLDAGPLRAVTTY
jgi:hypothetical protein